MKKIRAKFSARPYLWSSVGLVVIVVIGFIIFNNTDNGPETMVIESSDFKQQVAVSGKVISSESVDLGFEQGGKVSHIYASTGSIVTKGTVIAELSNADLRAEVLQKQASLERAEAELQSLKQGTRPEQLAIDQQAYTDSTKTYIASQGAAYLQVESALLTSIDTMFSNGNSVNPRLTISARSSSEQTAIEQSRLAISEKLQLWKTTLLSTKEPADIKDIEKIQLSSSSTFDALVPFMNLMSLTVNNLYPGSSGFSQTEIDTFRTSVNTAGTDIVTAKNTIQTAEATWQNNRRTLTLSEAGNTLSDIAAQSASVKAAQADVISAQARLAKTMIMAPFEGTITKMDIKVGEIVSANSAEISLMNTSAFEIESFVPEVHIANIRVGNSALVNLDAYGTETTFDAKVISVDPAETIRDGVSTYKVKLAFTKTDDRIRSGMTASVIIVTFEKPNAIVVPRSVVESRNGSSFIKRLQDGQVTEVPVQVGGSTSLGQIEIISGINPGDVVLIDATNK